MAAPMRTRAGIAILLSLLAVWLRVVVAALVAILGVGAHADERGGVPSRPNTTLNCPADSANIADADRASVVLAAEACLRNGVAYGAAPMRDGSGPHEAAERRLVLRRQSARCGARNSWADAQTAGNAGDSTTTASTIFAGTRWLHATRGGQKLIPWSSKVVRQADEALERGATSVKVGNRSQAEELFLGRFQGAGYRNTTGMSPTEAKNFLGQKAGTYHWDIGAKAFPHESSHLQVHTFGGDVIRIFFP